MRLSNSEKDIIYRADSADLGTKLNIKSLSKDELDFYWSIIISSEALTEIYNNIRHQHGYVANIDDIEYFIYDYYEKGYFKVVCYNMLSKTEVSIDSISDHNIELFYYIAKVLLNDITISVSLYTYIDICTRKHNFYLKLLNKLLRLSNKSAFKIKRNKNNIYFQNKRFRYNGLLKNLKELYCINKLFLDRIVFLEFLKTKYNT